MTRARDVIVAMIFGMTSLIWWAPRLAVMRLRRPRAKQLALPRPGRLSLYQRGSEALRRSFIRWMRRELIAAIPPGARVLDVGAGNGELAAALRDDKAADVVCLDVVDCNREGFATVLWDGAALPFPDGSFDVVLFSYVLHHSPTPAALVAEARRVSRRLVLVCEDHAPIARTFWARIHATTYNDLYDIDGMVAFHSIERWVELFHQNGLTVARSSCRWNLDSFTLPLKLAFFELELGTT